MKNSLFVLGLLLLSPVMYGCEYIDKLVPTVQSKPVPATRSGAQVSSSPTNIIKDTSAVTKPSPTAEPEIVRGTGVFVNTHAGAGAPVMTTASGSVTLNFADTDLREVVRAVLSQTLGLNYSIDPKLQGKVTLQTSQPISKDSVLPVLENVLSLNGAAMINDGGFYKIVTAATARQLGVPPILGSNGVKRGSGYRVRIVPLSHISATEMQDILEPFAPAGGIIKADNARNLLIMTGSVLELTALTDMVETFDVDWLSGMSFGLYPLESVDAKTMIRDLLAVFGNDAKGPLAGRVQFFPIERMNAVLVAAQRPEYLGRAGEWIERLDRSGEGVGKRLYVYYVENRRAEDLAPVLNEVFANTEKRTEARVQVELAPGLTPETVDIQSLRPTTREALPSTQEATVAPPIKPASGAKPILPVAGVAGVGEGIGFSPQEDIRIIADTNKNALLIMATPADYRIIETALRKLDVVPLQVLIEATIAEVTLNDTLKYGVEWFFQNGNHSNILSDLTSAGVISSTFPGFSYFFSTASTKVAIDLLASVTDVKVISSPQLMVLDNETASLQVGDQVPVATQSSVTTSDPDAPIVNSIQHLDTGVILEVTPRVNANGLVMLDIMQEVSDAIPTISSGIDSPTIQKRRIQSSVAIQNGETIALGGLIKDTNTSVESGLPLLKDIPILGHLFKQNIDTTVRTELLILLTPRVVRDRAETRQVTDELRRRLRSLVPLEEKVR